MKPEVGRMRVRHLALLFALVAVPVVAAGQQPAASAVPASATTPVSAKVWLGRNTEIEDFLRSAPFRRLEDLSVGVTRPRRGYFDPGGLAGSAAWKLLPPGRPNGYWESYKSEIAAYELDKLLHLDMVPPAVEKNWKGDRGAAILWVEGVRTWKVAESQPKPDKWNLEAIRMKMFDNLIANIDRNAGNLLIDADWNLCLIDHSRAFVTETKLRNQMTRIDRQLWDRMLALDEPTLTAALGNWLDRGAIRAILKRRDEMKKAIDLMVQKRTEAAVFVK
jgi:hypothetical protein